MSKFINISTYHTDFSLETGLALFYFKFEKYIPLPYITNIFMLFGIKKNDDLKNLIPLDP